MKRDDSGKFHTDRKKLEPFTIRLDPTARDTLSKWPDKQAWAREVLEKAIAVRDAELSAEWVICHRCAEIYQAQAEYFARENDPRSLKYYRLAAIAERNALEVIPADKKRTIGVIAVSAASLFLKANIPLSGKIIAEDYLEFAKGELTAILKEIELLDR